jgi:F1F0 ATPase subunit 2
MEGAIRLAFAMLAGSLLGVIFFGGLWWTVQRCTVGTQAALAFGLSFLLRTTITLVGFYFVTGADWKRLVACLAGFVVMRVMIMRLVGAAASRGADARGIRHVP